MRAKNIFVIVPPDDKGPGKYALVLYRQGNVMQAAHPVIVFVDRMALVDKNTAYAAWVGKKLIVRFPVGTQYMMLAREYAELMTPAEIALLHKEEEESVEKVVGKPDCGHMNPIQGMIEEESSRGYL